MTIKSTNNWSLIRGTILDTMFSNTTQSNWLEFCNEDGNRATMYVTHDYIGENVEQVYVELLYEKVGEPIKILVRTYKENQKDIYAMIGDATVAKDAIIAYLHGWGFELYTQF